MTTSIYIQNTSNQALAISNSVAPYLAPGYWASLVSSLPNFMPSEQKVMWFNRNQGIAAGSTWVFTTAFELGGTSVVFAEQITGTSGGKNGGSEMKQSITASETTTGWQDFNGRGPTFKFTAANNVAYAVNWQLTTNGDGFTDIHYTINPKGRGDFRRHPSLSLVVGASPTPHRRLGWHRNSPRRRPDPKPDRLLGAWAAEGVEVKRMKTGTAW